jgi:hypothetical protein
MEAPDPAPPVAINLVILGSGAVETARVEQLITASDFVHVLTSAQESTPGYRHSGD